MTRKLLVRVKAAKTPSATRVETPGQKGHYLSAYLSVFKVYSHELMPGEIIAICKQNKIPQWCPHLTFVHINGPTGLTRQLGHVRAKGQSWDILSRPFFFIASVGHTSGPVSSFPLALCTLTVLDPPQSKPFGSTPGSNVDSLYESDFCSPASTGAGHSSPVFDLSHHGWVEEETVRLFCWELKISDFKVPSH